MSAGAGCLSSWSGEQCFLIRSSIKKRGQPSSHKSKGRSSHAQPPGCSKAHTGAQEPDIYEDTTGTASPSTNLHHPGASTGQQPAGTMRVPSWSARPEVKFPCVQAEELMQTHLPSKLAGVAYHPGQCAYLAAILSPEIRDLVKDITPPRYKLVCSVSIGSKGHDGVVVASKSLWDPHADRFATSYYVNSILFCMALVHVIYLK
uniref:tctex1 domain-containing protein 1-like n=1 Tax=Urocitellus parryii TaxID=9999 RepID=UPI000E55B6C9|nr:tctex1 domain-containing protein 1-like [Urocitellus parryii]